MCASSLVLLSALRISHLRLLAFHQHCSEHYSCIGAVIKFCLFPLQRKCKTGAACECLKVLCPTPALTVNSLHTSVIQVSFATFQRQTINFIHTPSIPPFPMQQGVPECCTFLTLLFSLLGSTWRIILMSSQSPLLQPKLISEM